MGAYSTAKGTRNTALAATTASQRNTCWSWDRPLLTDSGGFQVFSLSHNRKIDEDGITFRSHLDGSKHYFTPERVIALEQQLGADIIMVLDECTPYPSDEAYNRAALRRTHA